jgi:hypothetical protein
VFVPRFSTFPAERYAPFRNRVAVFRTPKGVRVRKEPTARDRIIGARLRAIRTERAGLSLERAAEIAEWAPARLSRTERGLRHITTDEVATLLTSWKLPGSEREEVLAEIQASSSRGWWDRPIPGVPQDVGALASYEADATGLVSVAIAVVPGLLQTYETAVASMAAGGAPEGDIETRWMARLRRQQVLGKANYRAFISETALTTRYGGDAGLRGQLEHLLKAQNAGVEIRIMPARQTRVLLLHSWLMMEFPHTSPVVHVELTSSGAFYIHGDDVLPYTRDLERLNRISAPQADSRRLITEWMKGL